MQFNGTLMVGKAYTARLGLEPNHEPGIKLWGSPDFEDESIGVTP